jgi:flagellar hook-associated protein 3
MRITNKMMNSRVLTNLSMAAERYMSLQTQASSGKRINKPSDDPLGITKDLNFRSRLSDISQFQTNINHAQSWLSFSDLALNNVDELITEAKDLATQLGNDTYDESARAAGATQAREIFNSIIDAANSQYRNKYIFSGSKTNVPPILANSIGVVYQGDTESLNIETDLRSYLQVNAVGSEFLTKAVTTLGEGFDLNAGIQPNMWLTELNGGEGVTMGNGHIVIDTINGHYDIDISAAKNIRQVLDQINAAGIPNFTASISENGNSLDFEDTTANEITNMTPLALLHKGQGVTQVPGTFVIRTSDSATSITVDISAATTVGDVLAAINNSLAAGGINNVTASIDPTDNRIILTDTNAVPYSLVIEESSSNGTTASELGIKGEMQGVLNGEKLEPNHIMISEAAAGQTLAHDLGILKGSEFEHVIGDDMNPKLTYFTKISSLNNNSGINLGVIRITNGHDFANVDLSSLNNNPDATVMDMIDLINRSGVGVSAYINSDNTGIMIKSNYDDRSLMITEADAGRTASALGIFGSPDLLGNMMILEKGLSRNKTEEISATQEVFNKALDQLLTVRSEVGSRVVRADTTEEKLLSLQTQVTGQLSEVEDADILQIVTQLATAETIYQTSLASAARIMQQSLLDFLQ